MDRAEPHLTRTGLRHGRLDEAEVGFLGLTLRPRRQDDLTVHASRHLVPPGCMSKNAETLSQEILYSRG